ncbi:MAG TPA: hypothetical protein VND96_06070 [Candidatus Micrarchaeaceae archaeon]|nr:hypothetical protein [Candidatus Micrarchaeaceae archaeon]
MLEADTSFKRAIDRLMPRTGPAVFIYFGAITGLMLIAPHFAKPAELGIDGLAALAAASWCGLNFWRCRHAHCLVTTAGWSLLAAFDFGEAVIGRSVLPGNIHGDEQLGFLAILVAGLVFEGVWTRQRGTNAVISSAAPGAAT